MNLSGIGFELIYPMRLICLAVIPVLVFYFYRSLVDFKKWQLTTSLIVRCVIVLLLVLAISGLTILHKTSEQYVIFAVDTSTSIGGESAKKADEYLEAAQKTLGKNRAAFISFSNNPDKLQTERKTKSATEFTPKPSVTPAKGSKVADSKADSISDSKSAAIAPPPIPTIDTAKPQGTNIEAAIEAAVASMPPGYVPSIVLLSDGNQTQGDALRAALRSKAPISIFALPTRNEPEVQVSSVALPSQVRQGEPFYVEVVIDSNHDDEGMIQVYRGAHQVVSEKKAIKKGENRFRFRQTVNNERMANFSAKIGGLKSDTLLDNNTENGLVFTAGKPRVLIIDSDPKLIRELTFALEQEDIQVDVRPSTGVPDDLADLQNYELVILSNVPATSLTQNQMQIMRTYVQDLGGGFMMLGGEQSFGLGGYYKTVLEEILPVRSDFEKEKEKPSIGMALVIDKSGSMGGDKIEMAKSACRSAVELLAPSDYIGVVAFDGESFKISEMQSASNKGRVSDDIGRIEASGGTTMYPAMEMAYEMLQATQAKLKHVIILTDGISSPGDFAGLAGTMQQARITVSTVAIGTDADLSGLEEIAKTGNGRFYATDDPVSIPQIFAKETVTASKSAINEQPFIPQVIRATQTFADLNLSESPFLLGYVMTRPKPTSEVILATEKGDPLLVWWRYGLGMTVAFTSDAKSRWAAEWLSWPGYSKFWAQLVRQAMRKSETKGVDVQIVQRGHEAFLTLDAIDATGRFVNGAETELTLIDPQLANSKIPLLQTAPGRYVTQFKTPHNGPYHVELMQKKEGQVLYQQSRGLSVGYNDELRLRPTNDELLKSISTVSGGKYNLAATDVFAQDQRTALRPSPLWPWLVTLATLLLVLDVGLRRIDLSVAFGRKGPKASHSLNRKEREVNSVSKTKVGQNERVSPSSVPG